MPIGTPNCKNVSHKVWVLLTPNWSIHIGKYINPKLVQSPFNTLEINNTIILCAIVRQKTEMQLRSHIRNENMLRLQKDTLENKIKALLIRDEEYENLKKLTNVIVENGKFIMNDRKENEILILKSENSNLKKQLIIMKMN